MDQLFIKTLELDKMGKNLISTNLGISNGNIVSKKAIE
jgi:hypothetical protein